MKFERRGFGQGIRIALDMLTLFAMRKTLPRTLEDGIEQSIPTCYLRHVGGSLAS